MCRGETFGADETPADVDVLVVLAAFAGGEMVGTQEAVVGQRNTSGGHAVVIRVVRHRTAHAAGQATCSACTHTHTHTQSDTCHLPTCLGENTILTRVLAFPVR